MRLLLNFAALRDRVGLRFLCHFAHLTAPRQAVSSVPGTKSHPLGECDLFIAKRWQRDWIEFFHPQERSLVPLGKRFRLNVATLAIDRAGGSAVTVTIPAGATITVNSDQGHDGYVWVTWSR